LWSSAVHNLYDYSYSTSLHIQQQVFNELCSALLFSVWAAKDHHTIEDMLYFLFF